jgi:o-succinylbenzoate synthase
MMLPPLAEVLDTMRVVALPMAVRFRGVDLREVALFEGPAGWTEFSPFLEYDDPEASSWLAGALDFGWHVAPPPRRDLVPVNATVPAVPASEVAAVLARFDGCRTAKVKVAERGQSLADDVERVRAVRAEMGPEGRIRVDANAGWNVDEAERAIHALAEYDLEYVEQPCATVAELADVRRRVKYAGILIAADESVRKAEDPIAVARAKAADVLIVKAQPLGGIRRALDVVAQAGLPAVVSSALDSAIGIGMGAALAAALPNLDFDCGLGTASLLRDDVADARPREGVLPAGRLVPEADALRRLAAGAERALWWRERVTRCYRLLES